MSQEGNPLASSTPNANGPPSASVPTPITKTSSTTSTPSARTSLSTPKVSTLTKPTTPPSKTSESKSVSLTTQPSRSSDSKTITSTQPSRATSDTKSISSSQHSKSMCGSKRKPPPIVPKLDCPACADDEKVLSGSGELNKSAVGKPDSANTEFVYYNATLREIASKLTNEVDLHLIIPWIRKLYQPEYHGVRFRIKRNKYLLHLVLYLMNDEAWGIFRTPPPDGALLNPEELIANSDAPVFAEWEQDTMWKEVLAELPPGVNRMSCTIHQSPDGCKFDKQHGPQLDEEFIFLLYLTRPYCVLLRSPSERLRAASWLQALCTIRPEACSGMKRLRNQYIIAMLGYVHELRVAGPFSGPPWNPLIPLSDAVKMLADKHPVIDPCSNEADEFLSSQPMPEEGAFCYMAITGELLDTTMQELD